MLLLLRDYIRKEGMVSLQQLTRAFQIDASALLPMLDCWIKKGVIAPLENEKKCGGACRGCRSFAVVFYVSRH